MTGTKGASPEAIIRDIKRKTRRKFTTEEKIRIVLEGLRGEASIHDLCRKEGIHPTMYYKWSKAFFEAGKRQLNGDTIREAGSDEVKELRKENDSLKMVVAELTWAEMIRKVYEVDPMVCPQCGGQMKVIAFLTDYAVVDRIIDHLKLTFVAERPLPPQAAYQEVLMAAEAGGEYFS